MGAGFWESGLGVWGCLEAPILVKDAVEEDIVCGGAVGRASGCGRGEEGGGLYGEWRGRMVLGGTGEGGG